MGWTELRVLPNRRRQVEGVERALRTSTTAALWDALVAHAAREDYRYTFQLYETAAQAGDTFPLRETARLSARAERIEEAIAPFSISPRRQAAPSRTERRLICWWRQGERGRGTASPIRD
ncbi:MAG: hypothetical protein ACRDRA_16215 [Pseudonocardiaceae bacterium]